MIMNFFGFTFLTAEIEMPKAKPAKKIPYKVGDKFTHSAFNKPYEITKIDDSRVYYGELINGSLSPSPYHYSSADHALFERIRKP